MYVVQEAHQDFMSTSADIPISRCPLFQYNPFMLRNEIHATTIVVITGHLIVTGYCASHKSYALCRICVGRLQEAIEKERAMEC